MDEAPKGREEILAAIKAKADAIRAQRAAAAPDAPAVEAPTAVFETPVSSLNAAGRPAGTPQSTNVSAAGSVTQGVEIRADRSEDENLKKLLGGLGGYQNPLRGDAWQLDYRYYAEARRRLTQAGYEIDESYFIDRPLREWSPDARGWTKTASSGS